jgi:hypothetical protein
LQAVQQQDQEAQRATVLPQMAQPLLEHGVELAAEKPRRSDQHEQLGELEQGPGPDRLVEQIARLDDHLLQPGSQLRNVQQMRELLHLVLPRWLCPVLFLQERGAMRPALPGGERIRGGRAWRVAGNRRRLRRREARSI